MLTGKSVTANRPNPHVFSPNSPRVDSESGHTSSVTETTPKITLPADLLPGDGRFGAGPSKVPAEALQALADTGMSFMGTSHRQAPVRNMVGRLQDGLREFYSLPADWEIILGNGGATLFWDALTFGFIDKQSQHLSFGEFSSKFASAVSAAPHLDDPEIIVGDMGSHPSAVANDAIDVYALTHNETSTGVMMPLGRPDGASGLIAVDATSGAGGIRWNPADCDLYYFSPQKSFASDGGLWIAAASPAACERIERIAASDRWRPAGIDLGIALSNSRKNQTYNTPALATIFLTVQTVEWMNGHGGLEWAASRSDESSSAIYDWADAHELTSPFVADAAMRSPVVATIDLDDSISADTVADVLRANGIVDTNGYRKLGRNQLRLASFPAIEPDDARQLVRSIDHVLGALG